MLSNLSETCGCRLLAIDGEIGRLEDCLFDDREWAVRYLVADAAGWLPDGVALVATADLDGPALNPEQMRVLLTRENVAQCVPEIAKCDPLRAGEHSLRSARGLIGFRVIASGEEFGQVEDVLIDRANWTVRYVAVGPDRSALISPDWLDEVDWREESVHADIQPDALRSAPAPDVADAVDRVYETLLYAHFGRPRYW